MEAWAHIPTEGNDPKPHVLVEHLTRVSWLARRFARRFGAGDWAEAAGLWHDLGKYKPVFQKYLREQGDYEALEQADGNTGKEHAIVGALHALRRDPSWGCLLAYVIAGHHTGLPDWAHELGSAGALSPKLSHTDHLSDALQGNPPPWVLDWRFPTSFVRGGAADLHLWIRMVFSCLVDADFLDTERYMVPPRTRLRRRNLPSLVRLNNVLDEHLSQKASDPHRGSSRDVFEVRQEVLQQCRDKALLPPGLFSLTVPTGGGKTLSGMAFALGHALAHGKGRVIVAIPYTSIIEQNARVYRDVFGDEAVLEHHSNVDPTRQSVATGLATENWDAPIVVTTNVQLFESLFAARSSACRKLHNVANSVILLDEAQMLPIEFLGPILASLRSLVDHFGCSVVLSTATQPALVGRLGSGKAVLEGLPQGAVREIIHDPTGLARRLKRVGLELLDQGNRCSWETIRDEAVRHERVLVIVNRRRDCRELYERMPEGTVHLSALMCPEHRSKVIRDVKDQLRAGGPIRVVSTQLVEAGVDLDFPVVLRAMAGLDSLAQAAGRCNREGTLNATGQLGRVIVFLPPKDAPAGLLRKGQDAGAETLRVWPELAQSFDPEAFSRYFALYFDRVNSFDSKGILPLLTDDADRAQIAFRTAANRFHLIDDSAQVTLAVHYGDGPDLVDLIETHGVQRDLTRRLQRYTVSVPERAARALVAGNWIRPVVGLDAVYCETEVVTSGQRRSLYDETLGLLLDSPSLGTEDFVV